MARRYLIAVLKGGATGENRAGQTAGPRAVKCEASQGGQKLRDAAALVNRGFQNQPLLTWQHLCCCRFLVTIPFLGLWTGLYEGAFFIIFVYVF